jgi:hypothetical protein
MDQAQLRAPERRRERPDGLPRAAAGVAGAAVAVGAVMMTAALVAAPGPWTAGYVSEAGTAGMPAATAYRCGLVLLAVGVGVLGAAVAALPGGPALPSPLDRAAALLPPAVRAAPLARMAGLLLVLAGVLAALSGTVPCSARCPLPPYEASTAADLVHSGASILGMAALAFAMVAIAVAPGLPRPLRTWAAAGAAVTFPQAVVMAVAMLFVGRSPLTATAERIMLAVTVCWLVGAAVVATRPRPPGDPDR